MSNLYAIYAPDINCHYYESATDDSFCQKCDTVLKIDQQVDHVNLPKKIYDFCYTYDGQLLVSEKARDFIENLSIKDVVFYKITANKPYYLMQPKKTIKCNLALMNTRFINPCNICGNFESVVGANPLYLSNDSDIKDFDILITDLRFGSGREKSPIYICGDKVGSLLKKEFPEIDLKIVCQQSMGSD